MTHSVHTAHGIMLQDTEGEHHGQLVLSSMPKTGTQTLEITQKELPDCYIATRKSPDMHFVHITISGGEESLLKANRMNQLCCPFVVAHQMSCLRELRILWTFTVWTSALPAEKQYRKVFTSVSRKSDCRMKSSVGNHGRFLTLKGFINHVSQVQSNMLHHVSWAKFICKCHSTVSATSELYTMYNFNFLPLFSEQNGSVYP